MPFITAPSILSTKDAAGTIIVPVNRALRFVGASVVPDGPGQTVITIAAGTNTWNESGNVLTGGTPTTPNEFFGSNNDYDVIEQRNGIEVFRLVADGVQVTGRAHIDGKDVIELLVSPIAGAGVPAPIGSIGMRDNAGDGELWLKFNAPDTAWTLLDRDATDEWSLDGNVLTGGTPDTPDQIFGSNNDYDVIEYRNAVESLRHNTLGIVLNTTGFNFLFSTNSFNFGVVDGGATITSSDVGAFAHGRSQDAGSDILASAPGAFAGGRTSDASTIQATSPGSHTHGWAKTGGSIQASGDGGSTAFGSADNNGGIFASAEGSIAWGRANDGNITAGDLGAFAGGRVATGSISVTSGAGFAFGHALNSGSITVSGFGAFACGRADNGSITADQNSTFAHGHATSSGLIWSAAEGSHAHGTVLSSGQIMSSGSGSSAHGYADGAAAVISATNQGSVSHGYAPNPGTITSSGQGAFAFGYSSAVITAAGEGAFAHGFTSSGGTITATASGSVAQGSANGSGTVISSGVASFVSGQAVGGVLTSSGSGSVAFGQVIDSGTITSSSTGSIASGRANNPGSAVTADGVGSFAIGEADVATVGGQSVNASSTGSIAHGRAFNRGQVISSGIGALSGGQASSSGGVTNTITASGIGAIAHGNAALQSASLTASGTGSLAMGNAGDTCTIQATGIGAVAIGSTTVGNSINATANGAVALGSVAGATSFISASNTGAFAHGSSDSGGAIHASGIGSTAFGYCNGAGNLLSATGEGSFAFGLCDSGNEIVASGSASVAGGTPDSGDVVSSERASFSFGDDILTSAQFATTFGYGHINRTFNTIVVGRYSNTPAAGNEAAWVDTDPLFVAGNGSGAGSRSNAFQIDKDGKETRIAAQKNTAIRIVAAAAAVSARTDRTIVCDLSGAGGAITLPAGEDGLEYQIGPGGIGAAVYTITPNGGDTLDASITSAISFPQMIKYKTGVWYNMAGGGGGSSSTVVAQTLSANGTLNSDTDILFVDSSGGAFNVQLSNPALQTKYKVLIVDTAGTLNANNVTLVRFGAEMIAGVAADKLLQTDWGTYNLSTNLTNWFI